MVGITVRPARKGDIDDLREIYLRLYDERDAGAPVGITLFRSRPSREDENVWYDRQFERAASGDLIYLVAEAEGHAVGSCTIARVGPTESSEEAHVGELGILVREDMRGKGVGSALLKRSIAEARTRFDVVFLSVFSSNVQARRLYERFGFSHCGHLPKVVKRGDQYFDEERMVLDLSGPPSGAGANR
jgi:RimJ/RimL family protein N-acetyltransferase